MRNHTDFMHCLECVHLLGFFLSRGFYPLFFFFFAIIVFAKNPDHSSCEISYILSFDDCIAMFLFIMFFCLLWFFLKKGFVRRSLKDSWLNQANGFSKWDHQSKTQSDGLASLMLSPSLPSPGALSGRRKLLMKSKSVKRKTKKLKFLHISK